MDSEERILEIFREIKEIDDANPPQGLDGYLWYRPVDLKMDWMFDKARRIAGKAGMSDTEYTRLLVQVSTEK